MIILAQSQSASPQFDAGFVVERGTAENRAFIWRESDSHFAAIETDETGSTAGNVSIKGYSPLKVLNLNLHSGNITADNAHLILSSSAGSTIYASGTLTSLGSILAANGVISLNTIGIVNASRYDAYTTTNYTFCATAQHLILSSSAGSIVRISGTTLNIGEEGIPASIIHYPGSNTELQPGGGIFKLSGDLKLSGVDRKIHQESGHLILTSSVGSTVTLSASSLKIDGGLSSAPATLIHGTNGSFSIGAAAGISFSNATTHNGTTNNFVGSGGRALGISSLNGTPQIAGINVHTILSSSVGSLSTFSGSFRSTGYPSASLPNPTTVMSGTVTFVNDLNFYAIASNGVWNRILTGSF